MKPSIALVLGSKAPKSSKSPAMGEDDDEDEDLDASEEEVQAYSEFKNAKSPEEGAAALKAFVKLCGGY